MQLPIELLIIGIIFTMLIAWAVWKRITDWINKGKYNPDNDKSRNGEDQRRAIIAEIAGEKPEIAARKSSLEKSDNDVPRPAESEGRRILQTADSDNPAEPERELGKTGNSDGKPRKVFRSPFGRRK